MCVWAGIALKAVEGGTMTAGCEEDGTWTPWSPPPATSGASEAGDDGAAVELLRAALCWRARIEEALAPIGLSYETYRVLAELDTSEAAAAARRELRRLGLLERGIGAGQARVARTRSGRRWVLEADRRLERVAAEFAGLLGSADYSILNRLLARSPVPV